MASAVPGGAFAGALLCRNVVRCTADIMLCCTLYAIGQVPCCMLYETIALYDMPYHSDGLEPAYPLVRDEAGRVPFRIVLDV